MVSINNLASEISQALSTYSIEVTEGLEKTKKQVARNAVKKLKATSPVKTGEYARGWRTKKVDSAQVIYNATKGSITHLLEKGHAKRNGGRVAPRVHIRPVEQAAIDEFTKQVEQVIRR